ncbi:Hsp20/alpha crystallin family protein, partial [Chloroflexota bacterium]
MSNRLRLPQLRELGNNLRDNMNRVLEEGIASVSGNSLALDIYETEDAVVVKTDPLLKVDPEAIEVSITGNVLTIKAQSLEEEDVEGSYLRRERRFGEFTRSVTIPREVEAEKAMASYKNGILNIIIPKTESSRPQVI